MMTILDALRAGNTYVEDISRLTELDYGEVLRRLSVLETERVIKADHTGTFSEYSLVNSHGAA